MRCGNGNEVLQLREGELTAQIMAAAKIRFSKAGHYEIESFGNPYMTAVMLVLDRPHR
jgi:hypothetical protein